jgi:type I restriction enzyme M protein
VPRHLDFSSCGMFSVFFCLPGVIEMLRELTFDPKRYCFKIVNLLNNLKKNEYTTLGDIVDFLDEKKTSKGEIVKIAGSEMYHYVELQDIGYGEYNTSELRGWQLPSRAKHLAENGDIYFGSIWGSVIKWCYVGENANKIIVTNGCHRCRIKKDKEELLIDLLCYINSEGWGTQMRSLSRGSDGLAEVSVEDAKTVVIPLIKDQEIRENINGFITNLKEGRFTLNRTIGEFISTGKLTFSEPPKRPSHIVLV